MAIREKGLECSTTASPYGAGDPLGGLPSRRVAIEGKQEVPITEVQRVLQLARRQLPARLGERNDLFGATALDGSDGDRHRVEGSLATMTCGHLVERGDGRGS